MSGSLDGIWLLKNTHMHFVFQICMNSQTSLQ